MTHQVGEHRLTLFIMRDAAMVEGVRHMVSAYEAQQAAYMLDAMLPTPLLLDLQHAHAPVHIDPQPKDYSPNYAEMSTEQAAIDHSARVDAVIGGLEGMPSPVGKHWVLSAFTAPQKATLYGWHVDGTAGMWKGIRLYPSAALSSVGVIQPNPSSSPHDDKHSDYSMTLKLVRRACIVDGRDADLADVVRDAELCALAVAEGVPLPHAEQPGVSVYDPDALPPRPTLRRGDTGSDVGHMQQLLGGIAVDGVFGSNTEAAVVIFQGDNGLVCDGICGPATWAALEG